MRKFGMAGIAAGAALMMAGCTPEQEEAAEAETTEAEMPAEEDAPDAATAEPAEPAGEEEMTSEEEVDEGERTGPDDRIGD
ncbi:hypothetical protein [Pontixanthobacter gangjinensis]|uniref:Lipoprotein n=1 Tax=Pontixanthobacter gangjinensis TaxID=1028742 RepID=A0A6I4SN26_9SPHN|nr:hypothetical protein [Pontixanthobacter gangjinensis]MXO56152.1 hypothetical protein [Pontixanthobacter gangjinensis]